MLLQSPRTLSPSPQLSLPEMLTQKESPEPTSQCVHGPAISFFKYGNYTVRYSLTISP